MTTAVDTGVVPDWATGYVMDVPCIYENCDREVAWWGNQHGCRKGHCCDFHLREYLEEINGDYDRRGYIKCISCGGVFHSVNIYFRAVRI